MGELIQSQTQCSNTDWGDDLPRHWVRYEPLRVIGAGSFGTVYLCRDRDEVDGAPHQYVAVKAVTMSGLSEDEMLLSMNEISILQNIRHPHIIQFLDYFIDPVQELLCLVTEYVNGGDVGRYIRHTHAAHGSRLVGAMGPSLACGLRAASPSSWVTSHGTSVHPRATLRTSCLHTREERAHDHYSHTAMRGAGVPELHASLHTEGVQPPAAAAPMSALHAPAPVGRAACSSLSSPFVPRASCCGSMWGDASAASFFPDQHTWSSHDAAPPVMDVSLDARNKDDTAYAPHVVTTPVVDTGAGASRPTNMSDASCQSAVCLDITDNDSTYHPCGTNGARHAESNTAPTSPPHPHASAPWLTSFFVINTVRQCLEALHYLHQHGIVHRDIKASNVYLTREGVVKLGDFGVSKLLTPSQPFTRTFIGTPFYLSPELCLGEAYDYATDIWALGVLTYEMYCLHLPFVAHNVLAQIHVITEGAYPVEALRAPHEFSAAQRQELEALHGADFAAKEALLHTLVVDVVEMMLTVDPRIRPTAAQLLRQCFGWGSPEPAPPANEYREEEYKQEEKGLRVASAWARCRSRPSRHDARVEECAELTPTTTTMGVSRTAALAPLHHTCDTCKSAKSWASMGSPACRTRSAASTHTDEVSEKNDSITLAEPHIASSFGFYTDGQDEALSRVPSTVLAMQVDRTMDALAAFVSSSRGEDVRHGLPPRPLSARRRPATTQTIRELVHARRRGGAMTRPRVLSGSSSCSSALHSASMKEQRRNTIRHDGMSLAAPARSVHVRVGANRTASALHASPHFSSRRNPSVVSVRAVSARPVRWRPVGPPSASAALRTCHECGERNVTAGHRSCTENVVLTDKDSAAAAAEVSAEEALERSDVREMSWWAERVPWLVNAEAFSALTLYENSDDVLVVREEEEEYEDEDEPAEDHGEESDCHEPKTCAPHSHTHRVEEHTDENDEEDNDALTRSNRHERTVSMCESITDSTVNDATTRPVADPAARAAPRTLSTATLEHLLRQKLMAHRAQWHRRAQTTRAEMRARVARQAQLRDALHSLYVESFASASAAAQPESQTQPLSLSTSAQPSSKESSCHPLEHTLLPPLSNSAEHQHTLPPTTLCATSTRIVSPVSHARVHATHTSHITCSALSTPMAAAHSAASTISMVENDSVRLAVTRAARAAAAVQRMQRQHACTPPQRVVCQPLWRTPRCETAVNMPQLWESSSAEDENDDDEEEENGSGVCVTREKEMIWRGDRWVWRESSFRARPRARRALLHRQRRGRWSHPPTDDDDDDDDDEVDEEEEVSSSSSSAEEEEEENEEMAALHRSAVNSCAEDDESNPDDEDGSDVSETSKVREEDECAPAKQSNVMSSETERCSTTSSRATRSLLARVSRSRSTSNDDSSSDDHESSSGDDDSSSDDDDTHYYDAWLDESGRRYYDYDLPVTLELVHVLPDYTRSVLPPLPQTPRVHTDSTPCDKSVPYGQRHADTGTLTGPDRSCIGSGCKCAPNLPSLPPPLSCQTGAITRASMSCSSSSSSSLRSTASLPCATTTQVRATTPLSEARDNNDKLSYNSDTAQKQNKEEEEEGAVCVLPALPHALPMTLALRPLRSMRTRLAGVVWRVCVALHGILGHTTVHHDTTTSMNSQKGQKGTGATVGLVHTPSERLARLGLWFCEPPYALTCAPDVQESSESAAVCVALREEADWSAVMRLWRARYSRRSFMRLYMLVPVRS